MSSNSFNDALPLVLATLVGAAGSYFALSSRAGPSCSGASSSKASHFSKKAETLMKEWLAVADASKDKVFFSKVFDFLAEEIIADMKDNFEAPADGVEWVRKCMNHAVPGGKMNRGLTVVHTARICLRGRKMTPYELYQASILGWSVEWLQAFFLVADDLMDTSITRRGKPCWYRMDGVGNCAVNDSFLLEAHIYRLLKKHFGGDNPARYVKLLDLFHEVTYQTELGQLLDLTTQPLPPAIPDLNKFTIERHAAIVRYKTAFYSFYLPVALGMIMGEIDESSGAYEQALSICLEMGEYFQVQDDYLDCYGAPEVIGKIGTDIKDCKCSWLVVQAKKMCSNNQKRMLETHYGKGENEASEKAIKNLYNELNLTKVFEDYEEKSYKKLVEMIGEINESIVPQEVFQQLLKKIYKRKL
jgi:farnesyl diphosphate synthase|eukprot:g3768.t1